MQAPKTTFYQTAEKTKGTQHKKAWLHFVMLKQQVFFLFAANSILRSPFS